MRRIAVAVLALALSAGAAQAGGWATVGLSALPEGRAAGETWTVDLTVLQHGRTPLAGVRPALTIKNRSTGEQRSFPARPTGETGVYRASVVFPSAGAWTVEAYDGFVRYGGAASHGFGTFEIAPAPGGGSFPLWPALGAILGGAALAVAALAAVRARRARTAPVLSG